MADNYPNIALPTNEWVDLYQLTGITVGTALSVENIGSCDVYLAVQAAQPTEDHDSYNVIARDNGVRLANNPNDAGAWAFCNSRGGKISVGPVFRAGFHPANKNIPADFYLEIAKGNVPGYSLISLSGENSTVGVTEATIWKIGGRIIYPTVAAVLSISSTSANDTAGGTGARLLFINGLDENGNLQSEIVALNGITPVSTTLLYLRVGAIFVIDAGSLQRNDGTITALHSGNPIGGVYALYGISSQMTFTVPAGSVAFWLNFDYSAGKDDELEAFFNTRFVDNVWYRFYASYLYQNSTLIKLESMPPLPELADIEFSAIKTGSAGNARISAKADILLIDQDYL